MQHDIGPGVDVDCSQELKQKVRTALEEQYKRSKDAESSEPNISDWALWLFSNAPAEELTDDGVLLSFPPCREKMQTCGNLGGVGPGLVLLHCAELDGLKQARAEAGSDSHAHLVRIRVLACCTDVSLDTAKCTDSECYIGVEHPDKHRYVSTTTICPYSAHISCSLLLRACSTASDWCAPSLWDWRRNRDSQEHYHDTAFTLESVGRAGEYDAHRGEGHQNFEIRNLSSSQPFEMFFVLSTSFGWRDLGMKEVSGSGRGSQEAVLCLE